MADAAWFLMRMSGVSFRFTDSQTPRWAVAPVASWEVVWWSS
ncbi:hypothetical protein RRSWK_07006 [Rhodopirellula sp. SWK7]|nr:hypothetical protein RRSWK_07006 [Rhodopirellula sp. SWK7]